MKPEPIRVRLWNVDIALARSWATAITETGLEGRPNYTGLSEPDRYYNGYLGELGTRRLLEHWLVPLVHRVETNGRSLHAEFLVGTAMRELEVKTSSKPSYRRFMLQDAQWGKAEFFIGARLATLTEVDILGWLDSDEVRRLPVGEFGKKVPTRNCLYENMHDMSELPHAIAEVAA